MKIRYFRFIQIDKNILQRFLNKHPALSKYVDVNEPFNVRISKKPFVGLIHTIISQDETNEHVIMQWHQLNDCVRRISLKNLNKTPEDKLIQIVGLAKSKLIKSICTYLTENKINLKFFIKKQTQEIMDCLSHFSGLTMNSIKTFLIFSCFKQNVLCNEDLDFLEGLKIFLKKQTISTDDINNIKIEYKDELTLFSLCMWKIRNERAKK